MTLHLHIGAHKTATTHLQATLIRHRAQLAEAGIQFVRPDDIRALIGSGRRAAARMGGMPSIRRTGAGRRLERLDNGADRLVLSDENSLGQCAEIFRSNSLYPTAMRRLTVWRQLAAKRDTTIYVSIRNYADFLSGAYVQSIRNAALHQPDTMRLTEMPRRWTNVANDIRHAFPAARLRIWAYEDYAALTPRIIHEMTGLPLQPVRRRPMATPSAAAIVALSASSRTSDKTLDTLAADHPITPDNPKFTLWSEAQTQALSRMYDEDLAALRRDLGEDFLSP